MQSQPDDLDERDVLRILAEWDVRATALAYAPVGFGDHHWVATAEDGRRWFVTVADLALKGGPDVRGALRGLRAAMDTAASLREDADLDFVLAPLRTTEGETLRPLGARHALAVFPFMDGKAGDVDRPRTPGQRAAVLDLLAGLHRQAPPAAAPVLDVDLPLRALLNRALDGTLTWTNGPFADPARSLIADRAPLLRRRLEEFDHLARDVRNSGAPPVLTHGEPHPGNLLEQDGRYLLIDWDTVGVALPERDLWSVVQTPEDLDLYTTSTGRTPDPAALTLYRLRWDLDEVSLYIDWFRAPHHHSPDTRTAWDGLHESVDNLTIPTTQECSGI
ncbi:phosphotransferase enzyme family protein [Actinomadura macra]|uniref:phosphotransferase enzyme family protein n=1 Tax=Actinomadura macra TaxID=46164 RepID=UPI000AA721AA|nr:phosphotransferase [Actinomadura macra]